MTNIPSNYPNGCTNEQIISSISDLSKDILDSNANINTVLQLSPIISLGQLELHTRILNDSKSITKNLHDEVKRLVESSERNEKASKRISLAALIISFFSFFLTIYFSTQSNRQNEEWQQTQIQLLQKIVEKK